MTRRRRMGTPVKGWLTYANVMATAGVFLAMGGAAVAVTKVARNSVTSPSIKNGAVTAKDVKNASLKGQDVKDDALKGADIDEASLALQAGNANTAPTGPAGGELTGTYPSPAIASNVVTAAKIATGAVTEKALADGAVNSATLADGQVRNPDLATGAVGTANIANGSVVDEDIAPNQVGSRTLKDLRYYQTVASIPPQSSKNVHVRCGLDEIAITGGGHFTNAQDFNVNLWVMGSSPSFFGDAWNARGANPTQQAHSFTAIVICLPL